MKRWLIGIALVVVLAGCFWAYRWWHGPAEAVITTVETQTQQDVLGSETDLKTWQTAYFITRYPTTLRVISSNEIPQGRTEGQYSLGAVSLKASDQLAITVGELSDITLAELPAITLRQQQSTVYTPASRSFTPSGGYVFTKTDGYETSVFWQRGNMYAAVVVSGSAARQAELEQSLEIVIQNWQWRT